MKLSSTTTSGTIAGALLAAAQVPGLPAWLAVSLNLGAASALVMLGQSASDCPANCPGTDGDRHPRPWQTSLFLPLWVAIIAAAAIFTLSGCVTRNPLAGQGDPPAPAYVVAPQLNAVSNALVPIADTTGQVTGTGPLPAIAVNGILAAFGAISLLIARRKSQLADQLAQGVTKAGPAAAQTVLASSADSPQFAAVAHILNQHTGSGHTPGQPTPATPPK